MHLSNKVFRIMRSSNSALQSSRLQKSDEPYFVEQQNTIPRLWVLILKTKDTDKKNLIPTTLIVDIPVLSRYLSLFKYIPIFFEELSNRDAKKQQEYLTVCIRQCYHSE